MKVGKEADVANSIRFQSRQAPCGRVVDGESCHDVDHDGLATHDDYFACGCRSIRHELHDGSICNRVVHHNGRVLVDEVVGEHS
jgi:hypothetical protein